MRPKKIAVVGVGAVGEMMLRVMQERGHDCSGLRVLARSARDMTVAEQFYHVEAISDESFAGIDVALFAGTEGEKGASVVYSPAAKQAGAIVIDNGGDFRMDPDVPLIIPEVNADDIAKHQGLIANPNCSTIQMLVALAPIHRAVGLERIVVATYQAVSGAGRLAIRELEDQSQALLAGENIAPPQAFDQRIGFNVIPNIGGFQDDGYTTEEWKMIKETHKILHTDKIRVTATCVRVPVVNAHGEAIYIEVNNDIDCDGIRELLSNAPGIVLVDQPEDNAFSLPAEASGKDEVFVSRVRRDPFVDKGFWMWVVSDNLRKGAATNAVQILEHL